MGGGKKISVQRKINEVTLNTESFFSHLLKMVVSEIAITRNVVLLKRH